MWHSHLAAGKGRRAEWRPAGFFGGSRHASRVQDGIGRRACKVSGVGESGKRRATTRHAYPSRRDMRCSSKDDYAALTLRLVLPERGERESLACAMLGVLQPARDTLRR